MIAEGPEINTVADVYAGLPFTIVQLAASNITLCTHAQTRIDLEDEGPA